MAAFDVAIKNLFALEGGYSKHPSDPGGETYRGISRRYHPEWPEWVDVDVAGLKDGRTDIDLDIAAANFYRAQYWMPLCAWRDDITNKIGSELLDAAVHTNAGRAVEFLQRALNVSNGGGRRWHDVLVDGNLGPKTAKASAIACSHPAVGEDRIVFTQNLLQGAYLLERVEQDPSKEAFWIGWLKRLV